MAIFQTLPLSSYLALLITIKINGGRWRRRMHIAKSRSLPAWRHSRENYIVMA